MLAAYESSKNILATVNFTLLFAVIVCSKSLSENVSHSNNPSISTHTYAEPGKVLKTGFYKTARSSDKLNLTTNHVDKSSIFRATDCSTKNIMFTENYDSEPKLPPEFIPGEIQFQLGARNLPTTDPNHGAPDAFAELHGAITAITKPIDDNQNPNWPEVFSVFYTPEQVQKINIQIKDKDPIHPDDSIGYATFTIVQIVEPCRIYYTAICDGSTVTGTLMISRSCDSTGTINKIPGYLLFLMFFHYIL